MSELKVLRLKPIFDASFAGLKPSNDLTPMRYEGKFVSHLLRGDQKAWKVTKYNRQAGSTAKKPALNRLQLDAEAAFKNGILTGCTTDRFISRINEPPFVEIQYDNGTSGYVTMSSYSYDITRRRQLGQSIDIGDLEGKVRYLAATCLFGSEAAVGITSSGKEISFCDGIASNNTSPAQNGIITDLRFNENLTPSELSSAIDRQNVLEVTNAKEIFFEVPVTAYMLYGLQLKARGMLENDGYQVWCETLLMRGEKLIELERSLSKAVIIPIDPLLKYRPIIMEGNVSFQELLKILSDEDPWWGNYLEFHRHQQNNGSIANRKLGAIGFHDLALLSFVKTQRDMIAFGDPVIVVDDPQEDILASISVKSMKDSAIGLPSERGVFLGIYPFSHVGLVEETDAIVLSLEKYRCGPVWYSVPPGEIVHAYKGVIAPAVYERACRALGMENDLIEPAPILAHS